MRTFVTLMLGALSFGVLLVALCDISFKPIWRFRTVRKSAMFCEKITGPVIRTGVFGDVPAAADVVDAKAAIKALERTFSAHEQTAARLVNRDLRSGRRVNR